MEAKPSPGSDSRNSTPEPKAIFKDKKEAIEAFKELLREKVRPFLHYVPVSLNDFNFLLERSQHRQLGTGLEIHPARSAVRRSRQANGT
jgi:hypothetical protein